MKLVTFKSIEYTVMSEIQIKRFFQDRGLRLVDVARRLAESFPVKETSAEVMLHQLISGHRWYPVYADWLRDTYGVSIEKPKRLKPVRERMQKLAA